MLALLVIGALAATAAVLESVILLHFRGNQVGHFRALLVQAGDRCPGGSSCRRGASPGSPASSRLGWSAPKQAD
jgi:hypothetical protein